RSAAPPPPNTAGRPAAAARVLSGAGPLGAEADVLRGEALLQAGDPVAARAAVAAVPDAAPPPVLAARDRVLLLAELATDPAAAADLAGKISARYPQPTPGVAAALAAVQASSRTPGWDAALTSAAFGPGDPAVARHSAWLLVEALAADGRLPESAACARRAADGCAADLAYGWQTRFVAAADWALALHGGDDAVLRHAGDLTDRALPDDARGYATAATALIEADTGLLGAARAHLDGGPAHPATAWVAQETAWLDGQPDRARAAASGTPGLLAGLHAITGRWASYDLGLTGAPPIPPGLPTAARRTLTAWATGMGFAAAADGWQPVARREQIRCLLAAGLTDPDPQRAVDALLAAEQLADTAGLTVLAGRARRGLRRHHIHRDTRSPRSGDQLTRRETDVLRLVAAGEPTRRIAGQLGISAETVDTHIRAGMRKLGARTRTEAAALAFALAPDSPPSDKEGR
ncbi:helix-turn-helix transcriptional regulator, partial [Actinoplanes sp. NPDC051411]|uniref:helix-turn-helix transcriptional regulator n=1 Tax=Actinoplanes sp. NPDC051411 TaxID=3155522 RepID=UPI003412E66C